MSEYPDSVHGENPGDLDLRTAADDMTSPPKSKRKWGTAKKRMAQVVRENTGDLADVLLIIAKSYDNRRFEIETRATQDAASDKRCDGCSLWVHKYAAVGECMLPWSVYSAVRLEGDGCNELPTLLTPSHHSCAGWETKPPKAFEAQP